MMASNRVTARPSTFSLASRAEAGIGSASTNGATGSSRALRPCSNCTCSPGLLSRQGKRSSAFMKRLSRKNSAFGSPRRTSSSDSVYSSDTLCTTKNVNTTERLKALRLKMKENDLVAYIVPSEDEHQSEYVSAADQRRSFISGFTGSAGIAIITRDLLNFNEDPDGKSALSTDGRYFNQASQELDYNWLLLKQGAKNEPTWQEWTITQSIEQSLGIGKKLVKIGIDPKIISYKAVLDFERLIKAKVEENGSQGKVELVPIKNNLIDEIWPDFEEVPKRPTSSLIYLDDSYTGENFESKFERLKSVLKEHNSKSFLVSSLDEIAWLLNLRGSDIAYNPVFYSYIIINGDKVTLFTNNPYSDGIKKYFDDNSITVKPYESVWSELSSTTNILKSSSEIFLIPDTASWEIVRNLNNCKFKQIHSPIDLFKSIKTDVEIKNFEKAQLKDATAIVKFFAWLEKILVEEQSLIDEYVAGEKLVEFRSEEDGYVGNSFESISATGANAAVIHYSPSKENCAMIDPTKVYLADVGSQFYDGTTDITRTVHFTNPTKDEIDSFTLVLKGNLAIEQLVFPDGTNGYMIDCIARQYLWSKGMDYRHGTGHGIGSYLNVHEGPIGISTRLNLTNYPLQKGNILSNEPGYYEDGKFGIRIENDMLVESTNLKFGDKAFYKMRNLTLVPYCKKLINGALLSQEEKRLINDYHKHIWEMVGPRLEKGSEAYLWLKKETSALI